MVWTGKKFFRADKCLLISGKCCIPLLPETGTQGTAPCSRKVIAFFQFFPQKDSIAFRFFHQSLYIWLILFHVRPFTSERKIVYTSKIMKKFHSCRCKIFRTGCGIDRRQFQNHIGSSGQCHTTAQIFVHNRRLSPLNKIAAHGNNNKISAGLFSGFFYMVLMSFMKRIIFCNNPCCTHKSPFREAAAFPAFFPLSISIS